MNVVFARLRCKLATFTFTSYVDIDQRMWGAHKVCEVNGGAAFKAIMALEK
jgi:hypothetical protein